MDSDFNEDLLEGDKDRELRKVMTLWRTTGTVISDSSIRTIIGG